MNVNNLSNAPHPPLNPIPTPIIYILTPLFLASLAFSLFLIAVVHNPLFFLSLLFLSLLVFSFLLWNSLSSLNHRSLLFFLHSFPHSDLRFARQGQLVKITGLVSCGSVSLESSYEKVAGCIYTSTLLYEYKGCSLKLPNANKASFQWGLAYSERFSTDFYITDRRSGVRAMVKAGPGSKVVPLLVESRLVNTTSKCKVLSPPLRKWLGERDISADARLLRLEEGYIKEGSCVSVIGMLERSNDIMMIVEPSEIISTGCLWQKLLLPVDVDGLLLGI